MALHSLHLLSCSKHSISVLRSSKLVNLCLETLTCFALQKSSNTWKCVFCIANNISFHEKETFIMYLSFIHKIALSNFLSLRKKLFSIHGLAFSSFACCTKHSISVLRSSKLVILCIEALTCLALRKSSNTWKSVFCIANNISFHEKKNLSCNWTLLLKLHLTTFSHWERSFSASVALHSLHLLSCTKHSITVLGSCKLVILCIEALTWLALQKSSNTWKSVFCIANNISFHEKETSFMYLSFIHKIALSNFLSLRTKLFSIGGHTRALLLKLHLATFSHWERSFWASVVLHSLHLLSSTKHSISVLGSCKLVILWIEALTWLPLQKSSNRWKSVFCMTNNIYFMSKKHLSCTLELYS